MAVDPTVIGLTTLPDDHGVSLLIALLLSGLGTLGRGQVAHDAPLLLHSQAIFSALLRRMLLLDLEPLRSFSHSFAWCDILVHDLYLHCRVIGRRI